MFRHVMNKVIYNNKVINLINKDTRWFYRQKNRNISRLLGFDEIYSVGVHKQGNFSSEKVTVGSADLLRSFCSLMAGISRCYIVKAGRLSWSRKQQESCRNSRREPFGVSGVMVALLGFLSRKPQLSPQDELLLEIKRGILAMQEGEFQKAERHFADSWKMSQEQDLEDVKTQIMDLQANLAMAKGEIDKAIRLFQLVTQRLVFHQSYPATDNTIVEISIKLAQMYAMKGQIDESIAGFEYAAQTQKKKISEGAEDEDTLMLAAWSLQSLAQFYMGNGNIDVKVSKENLAKASQYAKEAYKYVLQAVGPQSQQAVAIASDLASIIALEGDVESALKKLDECDKVAAEKFKYLQAAIRVNTGNLYLQKGEYSEAERVCKEAKAIAGIFRDLESVMRAEKCIAQSRESKKSKGT